MVFPRGGSYDKRRVSHFLLCLLQNESEIIPFPNGQSDFSLPDTADFTDLQNKAFPRLISPKVPDDGSEHKGKGDKQDGKHEKTDTGWYLHLNQDITY